MRDAIEKCFAQTLESVFPRTCVLCGRELLDEARKPYPLCGSCEESLAPLEDPRCPICGKTMISELETCMRCRTREFAFDSALPLWPYAGPVKDLVIAYKVLEHRGLASFFADRIRVILESRWPGTAVVPVPPREGKLREKGWDQIEDIARILEKRGIPVVRCLRRLPGVSQKTLDYRARLSNLSGRIQMRQGLAAPPRVVLFDDVLTTGATLSECAAVLKAHGAMNVCALTIAAD